MTVLIQSVFLEVFPGSTMPWSENPSLKLRDMYDQVYSHLISRSPHRNTILQVLGQVVVAKHTPSGVNFIGSNSSSPKRIAAILGLEHDLVVQLVTEFRSILSGGDEYTDIEIRHPSSLEFLLDSSRSQDLYIDISDALLILQRAPLRTIFVTEGM